MRRLTIQFPVKELDKFRDTFDFRKVEWFEVVHFLELKEEVAAIARVKFARPRTRVEDIFSERLAVRPRFELLQREKGGVLTYFGRFRQGPKEAGPGISDLFVAKGYLSVPFELRNGRLTVTYLGGPNELRRFRELLDRSGVRYRLVTLEDARNLWWPRKNRLTEKQLHVLTMAYRMGYYDVPKETSIGQLARMFHLAPSTFDVELRRAERRLLGEVLQQA